MECPQIRFSICFLCKHEALFTLEASNKLSDRLLFCVAHVKLCCLSILMYFLIFKVIIWHRSIWWHTNETLWSQARSSICIWIFSRIFTPMISHYSWKINVFQTCWWELHRVKWQAMRVVRFNAFLIYCISLGLTCRLEWGREDDVIHNIHNLKKRQPSYEYKHYSSTFLLLLWVTVIFIFFPMLFFLLMPQYHIIYSHFWK